MNDRDYFAATIMSGICAGDWKLNIEEGSTWDEVAAKRCYEIADAMIKHRDITEVTEADFVRNAKLRDIAGEEL
jgi:hypothetical protein